MNWLLEHGLELLNIAALTVAVASAIANLTPSETDNKWVEKASKLVNLLALNFKK